MDRPADPATQGQARKLWDFVQGLTENDLIRLRDNVVYDLGVGNTSEGFRWLNTRPIDAVITAKGIEKLFEERMNGTIEERERLAAQSHISTIRLNNALELNIPVQNRIQRNMLLAVIITGLVSVITLIRDVNNPNTTQVSIKPRIDTIMILQNPQLDSLHKRFQEIQSVLNDLKTSPANK